MIHGTSSKISYSQKIPLITCGTFPGAQDDVGIHEKGGPGAAVGVAEGLKRPLICRRMGGFPISLTPPDDSGQGRLGVLSSGQSTVGWAP